MLRKIATVVFVASLIISLGWVIWIQIRRASAPVVKKDDEVKKKVREFPPDDFCPEYTRPEMGGKANLSFKVFDYDLTPRYFSAEDLEKMAAEDERMLK